MKNRRWMQMEALKNIEGGRPSECIFNRKWRTEKVDSLEKKKTT